MRGSGTRKSVPEPVWPRSGNVADHVKVFNQRYSPPAKSPTTTTVIEIKNDDSGLSGASHSGKSGTVSPAPAVYISPATVAPSSRPSSAPMATTTTTNRSHGFDISSDGVTGRNKSGFRRFPGQFQPNRDMSPIGECPSFDETEEERKTAGPEIIKHFFFFASYKQTLE